MYIEVPSSRIYIPTAWRRCVHPLDSGVRMRCPSNHLLLVWGAAPWALRAKFCSLGNCPSSGAPQPPQGALPAVPSAPKLGLAGRVEPNSCPPKPAKEPGLGQELFAPPAEPLL